MTLSCSVNVSPMGQSRVPAGWPLASNTGWGGAAAPNGAALTCMTEAPVTDGEPTGVRVERRVQRRGDGGLQRRDEPRHGVRARAEHRLGRLRQLVGRLGHRRRRLAETAGEQCVDRGRRALAAADSPAAGLGAVGLAATAGACSVTLVTLAV